MWATFWPDVLVAVIGAVLTVAIAYVTFRCSVRRNELRALTGLIRDLHHRRAFSGAAIAVPGAVDTADYARANASVLAVKDDIRHARREVRDFESLQKPLAEMINACNLYLEDVVREPDSYAVLLVRLRDALYAEIQKMSGKKHGVPALRPGDGAFR
ncbi:hypothetical protein ACLXNF_24585 [Mycobacteroides chelonae]|uniref:hypothetical protein n=1 Tax=Mycobacteroides chelonae TaxID=1774 RepID=UPI0039E99395